MKDKILSILVNVYYTYTFLCGLAVSIDFVPKEFRVIIFFTYIALCSYILIYNSNKQDEKQNLAIKNTNDVAILINNITKFNYNNLKIIKSIDFDFCNIKITLLDNINNTFKYEDLFFLNSQEELISLDEYLFIKYNNSNFECDSKDKKANELILQMQKQNTLKYAVYDYKNKDLIK